MTFQLVLQWNGPDVITFDELMAIEDAVIANMSHHGLVDGHDLGNDECNIFVETDDPVACWRSLKLALGGRPEFGGLSVGYRRFD